LRAVGRANDIVVTGRRQFNETTIRDEIGVALAPSVRLIGA